MKTYKKKIVKVVDQILCDCCGQSCSNEYGHEYAELSSTWGYCSKQDGTQYDIQLCETCFLDILTIIRFKRRKVLGTFNYPYDHDPLNGKRYFP